MEIAQLSMTSLLFTIWMQTVELYVGFSNVDCFVYRYVFGDVHLGQSCRLKASSVKDHILVYL